MTVDVLTALCKADDSTDKFSSTESSTWHKMMQNVGLLLIVYVVCLGSHARWRIRGLSHHAIFQLFSVSTFNVAKISSAMIYEEFSSRPWIICAVFDAPFKAAAFITQIPVLSWSS